MLQVTNTVYEGAVQKNLKHGMGQIVYPSGQKYKGVFKNDMRHGIGVCLFTNGAIYKGEWRDGKPMGNGILFSLPNEMIEGKFEGWKVSDGQVKVLFSNGEYYEGIFKNNLRSTQGT